MASSQEIVQIEEINKGLTTLNTTLTATAANYLKLVKTINDSNAVINTNVATTTTLNQAQRQTANVTQQQDALDRQLAVSQQRLTQLTDARAAAVVRNRVAAQQMTQALTAQARAEQAEEGSLVRMRQKLSELTREYDRTGTRTAAAAAEINNLSRSILAAEESTNRHQRNVGNYAEALGRLPGPLGSAVQGVQGFGASLMALMKIPIVAVIAGIAFVLGGLFKAFTSTDDGAVAFAGALKALGNVVDILMDRLWSYFKLMGSIITLDWEGMKKNGKDAFSGIMDQVKGTIKAGDDYAAMMDNIDDREAASANRTAKLAFEVSELKNKAAAATGKVKLDLLQQAMDKEIELNGIEKGFLTERNDVETMNLASKMQNSNMTMAQKEAQLKQWLQVDDKELESLTKKDAAFAEFVNKNEKEFQKLQKSKSDEFNLDKDLQDRTRRLQKGLAGERETLAKEGVQAAKDARAKIIENAEVENKKEIQLIKKRHIDGITSDDQYKLELENQEIKFQNKKASLYKIGTKEYEDAQIQIQDITIKSEDEILKKIEESEKEKQKFIDDTLKASIDASITSVDNSMSDLEKIKKAEEKAAEDKIKLAEKVRDKQFEIASELVNGVFDLGSAKRDEELSALDKEKSAKLANKNLTEAQKAKIEEEYAKKAAAIKLKQAKSDKLQAMFNIALNTAIGASKAVAESPLTGGMPFLAWVLALGAVQLGLAAAQPIPKFKHGTKDAPGMGIFGEAGRELMSLRSGELMMANKATYFEGSKFKGAQIFSNPETEKMMKMSDHMGGGRQMTDDRILNGLMGVEKAIKNKPVAIYDQDHRQIGHATSHSQTIYLSRLTRSN